MSCSLQAKFQTVLTQVHPAGDTTLQKQRDTAQTGPGSQAPAAFQRLLRLGNRNLWVTNTELHLRQCQSHFSFHLRCSFTLLNQFDQSLLGKKKPVVKLKSTQRFGKILQLYYGNGTSASILKLRTSCCPGDTNKPLEFKNHDEVPLPNSIVFYRQLHSVHLYP